MGVLVEEFCLGRLWQQTGEAQDCSIQLFRDLNLEGTIFLSVNTVLVIAIEEMLAFRPDLMRIPPPQTAVPTASLLRRQLWVCTTYSTREWRSRRWTAQRVDASRVYTSECSMRSSVRVSSDEPSQTVRVPSRERSDLRIWVFNWAIIVSLRHKEKAHRW